MRPLRRGKAYPISSAARAPPESLPASSFSMKTGKFGALLPPYQRRSTPREQSSSMTAEYSLPAARQVASRVGRPLSTTSRLPASSSPHRMSWTTLPICADGSTLPAQPPASGPSPSRIQTSAWACARPVSQFSLNR